MSSCISPLGMGSCPEHSVGQVRPRRHRCQNVPLFKTDSHSVRDQTERSENPVFGEMPDHFRSESVLRKRSSVIFFQVLGTRQPRNREEALLLV